MKNLIALIFSDFEEQIDVPEKEEILNSITATASHLNRAAADLIKKNETRVYGAEIVSRDLFKEDSIFLSSNMQVKSILEAQRSVKFHYAAEEKTRYARAINFHFYFYLFAESINARKINILAALVSVASFFLSAVIFGLLSIEFAAIYIALLLCALAIGALIIEARVEKRSSMQSIFLYAAAYLLAYEGYVFISEFFKF